MKLCYIIPLLALSSLSAMTVSAENPGVVGLAWICGSWALDTGMSMTIERWKQVSPQTIEGISEAITKENGDRQSIESLRIVAMGDDVYYLAKVGHNEMPIPFRLTSLVDKTAVFENPNHDFPRKLTYTRTRDTTMVILVEGVTGNPPESRRIELVLTRKDSDDKTTKPDVVTAP